MRENETKGQTFRVHKFYTTTQSGVTWDFEVTRRTARFITIKDMNTEQSRRVGVFQMDDTEAAFPLGSYANAPIITADRMI